MTEPDPTTSAEASSRFWLFSFWAVLVLAFVNRWAMSVTGYASTFDTGTPGWMAVNILNGERPLFFYGQDYMGALEAYVAALLFSLFGISETVKTLSPILFSLGWIAATYALFTECLDRKAGLGAALVLAYPGWQTLWYNIGTYGGYPGAFFFGTTVLWLSVRVLKRKITGRELLVYIPWIGLLAGMGIWTNYICGAYLGLAAVLLLIHKVTVTGFRRDNLAYLLAALPFLLAVSPVLESMLHSGGGGRVASFSFRLNDFQDRFALMTSNLIPELYYWPFRFSDPVKTLLACMLIPALAVTGVAFWKPGEGIQRRWMMIPVYFVIVYLALYFPHSMASIRASRYLIPGFSVFLCIVFSYGLCTKRSGWQFLASIVLIYWIAYNAFSAKHMMDLRVENTIHTQAARQEIIEICDRLGLSQVSMVGGYVFGHLGQTFSYLSEGRIAFGSLFDERHPITSQALEAPDRQAFLCERGNEHKVRESLRTLEVPCKLIRTKQHTLFYDLEVTPRSNQLLSGHQFQVSRISTDEDVSALLSDRHLSTYVEEAYGKKGGWVIDLLSTRTLNQIWMTSPKHSQTTLPKDLVLQTSLDGETWTTVFDRHSRVSLAYTKGEGIYFLGYRGIMEYRFPDTRMRYLKLNFRQGSHRTSPAKISELYLFESAPRPAGTLKDDLKTMEQLFMSGKISFLTADRWVSGSLYKWPRLREKVLPRYNPKFSSTRHPQMFKISPGAGLAVDRALAEETKTILRNMAGPEPVIEQMDLNYYTVFWFQRVSGTVLEDVETYYYNGHSLLRVNDEDAKGP